MTLLELDAMIYHANLNGQKLISVFIHLESAFSRVWHYQVLQSLHEQGLRGPLPGLIQNYL